MTYALISVGMNTNPYSEPPQSLFISDFNSPYTAYAYNWDYNGYGTKYSDPTTSFPSQSTLNSEINADNSVFLSMGYGATRLFAYNWSISTGWGTKFTDPSLGGTTSSQVRQAKFSPDGNTILMSYSTTPFFMAYAFSTSTGFGTKYADPSGNPGVYGTGVGWTSDGANVFGASYLSPNLWAYTWSSGFGTKYAAPATTPPTGLYNLAVNPVDNSVAFWLSGSPYFGAYAFSSGWGSKYTNPTGINFMLRPNFTNDGSYLGYSGDQNPWIAVFPWSSGFGTKYANPSSLPGINTVGIGWSKYRTAISTSLSGSSGPATWKWSSAGFGTKYANPATMAGSAGENALFTR